MKLNFNHNLFVSKKNYYLILIFDKIFKLLWRIASRSGVWRVNPGKKNRVLFIGPTHLGDLLLSTPAIRFAKEKIPNLEIICIVSTSGRAVLENNPHVDSVKIIDLPWFSEKDKSFVQTICSFCQFLKMLKKVNAETAVNYSSTAYHREHLAFWLAGIPHRIGFSHKGFGYFLTGSPSFLPDELISKQKLHMIGYWLGEKTDNYSLIPDYFTSQTPGKKVVNFISEFALESSKALVGINPGARHNFLWPESHWVDLCNLLFDMCQPTLVFLGTKNFESFVEKVRSQLTFKNVSLVGMTSLDDLAVVLKRLDILITIDTGTRHIANAVGTSSMVLRHGADSIFEFGAYVETEKVIFHPVPCSPCGRQICPLGTIDCMTGIALKDVLSEVKKYLIHLKKMNFVESAVHETTHLEI